MEESSIENITNTNNTNLIENKTSKRSDRETGFEILRIIAIFLISCVHLMNYGGLLGNAEGGGYSPL